MGIFDFFKKKNIENSDEKITDPIEFESKSIEVIKLEEEVSLEELYIKAKELRNNGKLEEVIIIYEKILKIDPNNVDIYLNKGSVFSLLNKYDEANKSYNQALNIKPRNYDAWLGKASALKDACNYDDSFIAFDQACKIKSDDFFSWYGKGETLYHLRKYIEAIEAFDQARSLQPTYIYPYMLHRVDSLFKLGKYDDAMKGYEEMLKINPDNLDAQNGLDAIKKHIKNGNCEPEIQEIQTALKQWYRQCAILWWRTHSRDYAICDDGNEKILPGEGYLRPGYLVCEGCIDIYFTYVNWSCAKYDLNKHFGPNLPVHIIKLQLEKKEDDI